MTIEEIKRKLEDAGFSISEEKRLGNDTGFQLKLTTGQIVNVWDKGTWNVQGKNPEEVRTVLDDQPGATSSLRLPAAPNKVFVVYGHDKQSRDQLEAMLRRWGLEPLILDQLPSEGQTIIEKLESITANANFGVVLATPDDEGYRVGHEDEKAFRARQNVVLELGMLLAKLGRKRVAILLKQQENMERPSDIQGLIYIPFKDDVQKDAGLLLAKEMVAQGYKIDISRL
ncbi:DNA-binding protein [Candidatus Parcubacteria bacterium]|nr:MAG: DNA-binding protein [Candidatus Parcubacteria bacterium]